MIKTKKLFYLILLTFCACSDEFIPDQIEDNYSVGTLVCPQFEIEEEFQNVQISYFSDGGIEIDLGLPLGILEGNISNDSEITMQAYQGFTSSGIELDLPSGTGDFSLREFQNNQFKSVNIRFQTLEDRLNICTLILNEI